MMQGSACILNKMELAAGSLERESNSPESSSVYDEDGRPVVQKTVRVAPLPSPPPLSTTTSGTTTTTNTITTTAPTSVSTNSIVWDNPSLLVERLESNLRKVIGSHVDEIKRRAIRAQSETSIESHQVYRAILQSMTTQRFDDALSSEQRSCAELVAMHKEFAVAAQFCANLRGLRVQYDPARILTVPYASLPSSNSMLVAWVQSGVSNVTTIQEKCARAQLVQKLDYWLAKSEEAITRQWNFLCEDVASILASSLEPASLTLNPSSCGSHATPVLDADRLRFDDLPSAEVPGSTSRSSSRTGSGMELLDWLASAEGMTSSLRSGLGSSASLLSCASNIPFGKTGVYKEDDDDDDDDDNGYNDANHVGEEDEYNVIHGDTFDPFGDGLGPLCVDSMTSPPGLMSSASTSSSVESTSPRPLMLPVFPQHTLRGSVVSTATMNKATSTGMLKRHASAMSLSSSASNANVCVQSSGVATTDAKRNRLSKITTERGLNIFYERMKIRFAARQPIDGNWGNSMYNRISDVFKPNTGSRFVFSVSKHEPMFDMLMNLEKSALCWRSRSNRETPQENWYDLVMEDGQQIERFHEFEVDHVAIDADIKLGKDQRCMFCRGKLSFAKRGITRPVHGNVSDNEMHACTKGAVHAECAAILLHMQSLQWTKVAGNDVPLHHQAGRPICFHNSRFGQFA